MAYDAAKPGEADAPPKNEGMMKRGAKALKASEAAFRKASIYHPLWQAQAEIFYPERADFTTTYSAADERYDGLHTSVPSMMRRDMASNLGAMIRPRGRHWFNVSATPVSVMNDDAARRWCEESTDTMRNIVYDPRARFPATMAESDNDYVTFGSSVVTHPYRRDQTGILFSCLHLRDCAWSRNEDGVVDTMHHKRKHSLRQIVAWFGKDALPAEWRREFDKGHTEEMRTIICSVMPLDVMEMGPKDKRPREAKYISIYSAHGASGDCCMGEYFFTAFPYTVREWMSVSGEEYARSPCTSVALADARTLNVTEEDLLTSIEQAVRPAKYAKKGVLLSDLDLRANTVTFISDDYDTKGMGPPIANIDQGDPRYAMEFSERMAERIGMAFFQNILKLPTQGDMTAYEVAERIEIYTREAAPLFEPMEAENAHIMDSVFTRAMAKGAFGEILPNGMVDGLPDALKGREIRFEFETPLSQALKKQKAIEFDSMLATATGIIGTQHPAIMASLDNADWDEAFRDGMRGKVPEAWIMDKEAVAAKRQADAEAADAARQEATMTEAAMGAMNANPENLKMAARAMKGEEIV